MEIKLCKHCGTKVLPMDNGCCPHCRQALEDSKIIRQLFSVQHDNDKEKNDMNKKTGFCGEVSMAKDVRTSSEFDSQEEIEKDSKKPKFGISICLFFAAAVVVLLKPLIIKLVYQIAGGHGGGYVGHLRKLNQAATVAGTCYIVAALLAIAGGIFLVRSFYIKFIAATKNTVSFDS